MMEKRMLRLFLTVSVAVLALIFVSGALAASKPAGYQTEAGVQGIVQTGTHPSLRASHTVGQLPFTGADLGVFGAGAVALILAGFSFRRLGRRGA